MASSTRTTPRPGARFGRPSPSPGPRRFSRSGPPPSAGRFARGGTANRPQSTFGRVSGRKPKKSSKGIASTLTGLLPATASKATPSSKTGKLGGFAALAAGAGVAFHNRDKLAQLLKRDQTPEEPVVTGQATYTPPPPEVPEPPPTVT